MKSTKKRPRASRLDRERILETATAIARKEGTSAVTMARVATELGARDASLYYHISSLADLIQGIVDRAGESVVHPDQCDVPETEVENILFAFYECLCREAWVVPHIIQGKFISKAGAPLRERALRALHRMGLDKAKAFHAYMALLHYTFGEVLVVDAILSGKNERLDGPDPVTEPVAADFLEAVRAETFDYRDLYRTTLRRYLHAVRIGTT